MVRAYLFTLVAGGILVCEAAAQMAPSPQAPAVQRQFQKRAGSQPVVARSAPAQPAVSQPAVPAAPLAPEQLPSNPPQVAFSSGILTIVANNSTLGDILRAVHRQTGASVDVPGNATERVVGQFGPGPARDVLASMLNGSHFNYVLLGSQTNPNALDRVMLLSKSATGGDQPAQSASVAPSAAPTQVPQTADGAEISDDSEMTPDVNDTADDQANQPATDDQQAPAQANPFGQPGAAVKTPEQLLQELQQRQQQVQQQQQQQPGFPPTPLSPAQPPH